MHGLNDTLVKTMKRRYLPAVLVFLVVFSVVASGCLGGGGTSSTTSSPSQGTSSSPQVAAQLVIGVTDKVTDLDPANAYDFYTWEVLNNVMEGLVKYKPGTLEIEPGLAKSWDCLLYTSPSPRD
jgi:peptide/nickel transport system substrate-binding protein